MPVLYYGLADEAAQKIPAFKSVIVWHEPMSTQSFVLNVILLTQIYKTLRLHDCSRSMQNPWVTFIRLDDRPTVVRLLKMPFTHITGAHALS